MKNTGLIMLLTWMLMSCHDEQGSNTNRQGANTTGKNPTKKDSVVHTADAQAILAKKEVPVLCYHDIRNTPPGDYSVPINTFKAQMQMLADSGYHSITPDQYYEYLVHGASLPEKPVMISFDDNDEEHYAVAAPELEKHGYRGVFFIMRITIGRPRYMSREQIKELSDRGHVIASHTWDHHKVTEYKEEDWEKQVTETTKKLEEITGKKVEYFAYPFGLWKPFVIPELKKRNLKAAFQLAARRDSLDPLYSIRRMIVPGNWDGQRLHKWMKVNFK